MKHTILKNVKSKPQINQLQNRHKNDIQYVYKRRLGKKNKMLNISNYQDMEIKTTMRHYKLTKMAKTGNTAYEVLARM